MFFFFLFFKKQQVTLCSNTDAACTRMISVDLVALYLDTWSASVSLSFSFCVKNCSKHYCLVTAVSFI